MEIWFSPDWTGRPNSSMVLGLRQFPHLCLRAMRALPEILCIGLMLCTAVPSVKATSATQESSPTGRDWIGYGRTSDEDHFSPLHQIDSTSVGRLGLAWYVDLNPMISTFAAPLAIDGTLYFAAGYSVLQAMDANTGRLLWSYDPKVTAVAGEKLRAAHGIRGIAYGLGKIFAGTQDGRLIAVEAASGRLAWSIQTIEGPNDGRFITGAPRVFGNKVIIGHAGSDQAAVRGYVTVYDAATGRQLWRFYTVPGDPAKGFENASMEMAAKTWTGEWWKYGGGGTVWNAITYDADLNRVYIGTGNGDPWNQKIRSPGGGDNLFICSIVALDADTGAYIWHYQTTPGDTWDFDASNDMELATLQIQGRPRKVLLHAAKNGFFYVIDRTDGRLISAEPFSKVTWASRVDYKSGRPVEMPDARFPTGSGLLQPGGTGAHNWEPMAYSPQTRLAYVPTTSLPFHYDTKGIDSSTWRAAPHLQSNTGYNTLQVKDPPPVIPAGLGSLQAWDPIQQKSIWSVPMVAPYNGGVTATAGNLVLQGNAAGRLVAYAADTGRVLWSFDAQDGIIGQPITYLIKDKQFVTVITGFTGVPAAMGPQVAQFGWDYRTQHRRVLTFALDATARLPTADPVSWTMSSSVSMPDSNEEAVNEGVATYGKHCFICHGVAAVAGGGAPDLRKSPVPLDPTAFESIVRGGALESRGMPKFQEFTDHDLMVLRQYFRYEAHKLSTDSG